MAAEIITGLSAFKAMFDAAKGLKDINDTTIRNGAVVELQEESSPHRRSRRRWLSA